MAAHAYPLAGGPPCIIGHVPSRSSAKTLLAYAHYDVQPAGDVSLWPRIVWMASRPSA